MLMRDVDADERWCRARRSCQQLAVMPRWRQVVRESAVGSLVGSVGRQRGSDQTAAIDGWLDGWIAGSISVGQQRPSASSSCCCWSWPATASCRRGRAAPSRHRPPLRPWTSSCHRVAEPSKRRWRIHSLMLMVQLPMLMLMPLSKRVSPPSCSQRWKAEWVQARAACRSSQERPRPRASRTCSRSPGRAPPSSASCCSHMHEESARQTHTSSSCSFAC